VASSTTPEIESGGNVDVIVESSGSSVKNTSWSGTLGFSVTEACQNKDAAVSLILCLTNDDSQKIEAPHGALPTRTAVWEWDIAQAANDPYKKEVLTAFQDAAKYAFAVPPIAEWIEISNVVYPERQAAVVGDKTPKAALDEAAEKATKVLQDAGKI
jgi:multiple sugar transport system substrate-binding protein